MSNAALAMSGHLPAIDNAFDAAIDPHPPKRRKTEGGAVGFDQIPLSLIPAALQRLDLPPDDEQILAVFKNAASGWTSSSISASDLSEIRQGKYVSRDDWRSVCAVLLEGRETTDSEVQMLEEDEDDGESDVYEENQPSSGDDVDEEFPSEASDDDDDEYNGIRPVSSRRSRRGQTATRRPFSESGPAQVESLTRRQRETCSVTFALFFPEAPPEQLHNQRIAIKDIQAAAKLLNEKLKADEIIEMLDMFSTSPDKSLSFQDFCNMMVIAKLA